jgi:intracellular multiplication protein IcmK
MSGMSWLLNITTSFCLLFFYSSVAAQAQSPADFKQQLQRLQTAVTSAKQANTQLGSTPAFNPNPQAGGANATGIAPPVTPGTPGSNQSSLNVMPTAPPAPTAGGGALAVPTQESLEGGENLNIRDEAFTETTNGLLPLTPDQIRTLHNLFSNTQRAVGEAPGIPPRPTSTSKIVNLSPGATPPLLRLSAGFVSSLVFLDATGAPWPIEAYDLGDPKSYNIQWDKKSNMLLVQAITESKSGNLAVMLRGLNTPIMITLLAGQRAVDYRVDLRVPGLGPNAAPAPMPESLPGASNPVLLDVLNGVAPVGARALKVIGRDCSIWLLNGKIYLRTRLTVLSPGWISTLSSADGMHAYEMQQTPVILASENGKMVKLIIQGL